MYRYLNIRGNRDYSVFQPVAKIQYILQQIPEISVQSARSYVTQSGLPWAYISIIACDSDGNYPAGLAQESTTANLIELICSQGDSEKFDTFYINIATTISKALAWEIAEV